MSIGFRKKLMLAHSLIIKEKGEMEGKAHKRMLGGRPSKAIKRNKPLTVKCTTIEKAIISGKAKKMNQSVSEYLRTLGLNGKSVMAIKTIPKEILALCGALNHVGALLNQIAKRRNSNDELNALERADLALLQLKIKEVVEVIKTGIK
ncbi:plasmid mobilization protein [Parafilimonas sp.]|uniref:plasmid mobilization protein n=1 Tax=Parafilimonas sp. TaxID=1969739 RepID=UPI003F81DD29